MLRGWAWQHLRQRNASERITVQRNLTTKLNRNLNNSGNSDKLLYKCNKYDLL